MTEETITRSGRPRRSPGRAHLAIVALTCGGAALIAGCTSSSTSSAANAPKKAATSAAASDSPTGAASPTAATCVHINSLRTSLTSLTHIKVSATSASTLTKDLANIEAQLSALKGQNLGSFSTQANQLTVYVNKIKNDAAELSTNPAKAATALSTDLTTLKTKSGPMIAEMKKVCHVT